MPHEQFRKLFKTSQRHIERDFTALQKESAEAIKTCPPGAAAAKLIDGMITRVEGLKRKVLYQSIFTARCTCRLTWLPHLANQLSDLHANSTLPAHAAMRRRLNHLAAFESLCSTDQPEFSEWADTRLDRWLVDWALRTGKEDTAKAIAEHGGIEVSRTMAPISCTACSS